MSVGILILEIGVVVIAIGIYFAMVKMGYKKVWKHFLFMLLAILLFMMMSEPMYRNPDLDSWAYLYRDVAWTVILGWTDIFLISIILVNKFTKQYEEKIRFWFYLIAVTVVTVIVESVLLLTSIREYSPILTDTFSGSVIPFTTVPIEVVMAIPILTALIIGFYKYFLDYY